MDPTSPTPPPHPRPFWASCNRADWLLDYAADVAEYTEDGSPEHRAVTLACCLCARTLPSLTEEDKRHLTLLEIWALGGEDGRTGAENTTLHTAVFAACNVAAYVKLCSSYASYCAHRSLHGGLDREEHLGLLADLIRPHLSALGVR